MKNIIIIILISTLISCCKTNISNKNNQSIETNLVGNWRFLSSTDNYIKDHQIIILEDSTYYMFSKTNGGGLIERGKLTKNDSLVNEREFKHGLKKIDTNKIEIENHYNFFGDFVNTYEKRYYNHYKIELNKRLKIDSTRNLLLGWWKLTKSNLPIKLPNYSGEYRTFTMQIMTDGNATFYLNNYLDSIVNYRYRAKENGIEFGRGDVSGSGTKLFFKSDTIIKMLMNKRSLDTLELNKIYKVK